MTSRALALSWIVAAAGGCDVRPLMSVEPSPDAAPPEGDAAPAQIDGGPIIVPVPEPACWSNQLPAQVQPMLPRAAVADSCGVGATATAWSYPSTSLTSDDGRANIVGRWVACGATVSFPAHLHAGVEFGANGRWRLLAAGADGALVPMTGDGTTGYYYLLGTGQLNVMGEGPSGIQSAFVNFAAGMDALRFDWMQPATNAIYARTAPSPLNGYDNLPSVDDGRCSMIGTWDLPANPNPPGAPAATFSFDGAGNFVGGPLGSDLCAAHSMYGTYRVSPGWFQLTSNIGLGACQWWFTAGYPAVFTDDCSSVTLTQQWDNCTGGRGYFNQVTTMTRRP